MCAYLHDIGKSVEDGLYEDGIAEAALADDL